MISDLSMPGISGLDLLGEVKVRRPDLDFILTSGHALDLEADVVLVRKPYTLDELLRAIEHLQSRG
ncbi:MAG: hypothetical protein H6834_06565 [Planctomycetes bacterium]|nr:hypothetical protein [Planctomycetota bacterium]MCB9891820.1 hypothetical protein [Planctomycetota bacterium]